MKIETMSDLLGTDYLPEYVPTQDEKNIAILAHVLSFVAPILAPLLIYIIKKNDSPFIAAHAKESFNFHITLMVVIFISIILIFLIIGIFMLSVIGIYSTVLIIVAAIRASEGRLYKYPFTIEIIK